MKIPFFQRLYVRIWLAVLVAVLLITFSFGALWRAQAARLRAERLAELPTRAVIMRNAQGEIIGQSNALPGRGRGLEFALTMADGQTVTLELPPHGMGLPQPPPRDPGFLLWMGLVMAAAVALGSYPVVRRLTRRLERLRQGVERWGAGDLRARVEAHGDDEVAFLGERFNHAADRVEALVRSHQSLLANASHELRAPLARIRMGVELLESPSNERIKAELARSMRELDALIEELLLASRLDAAQHSAGVALGAVETVDMLALAAEECARHNVALECAVPELQLVGVPRLLQRLLRNLLDNAQRYSGGRGVHMVLRAVHSDAARGVGGGTDSSAQDGVQRGVESSVRSAGSAGVSAGVIGEVRDAVEIEVCDRGPGVLEAERARIFEPFYRASYASESDGGVGLGLALVQAIAQRHGGHARCLARDGGGARFLVLLRAANTTPD
jgi:two-component system, OmpR family, sensor kinase